jgi:hypothetical protein
MMSQTTLEQPMAAASAVAEEQSFDPSPAFTGSRRISAFDFLPELHLPDTDHDSPPVHEELPAYTTEIAPPYEERQNLEPVLSYGFYQIGRKLQIVTPATRATIYRPRYRITTRSATSIFSKKPEYTLTKLPTGADAAVAGSRSKDVATMNFDRNGELPWMPRATVVHYGTSSKNYPIEARNFSDWNVKMDEETYTWRLADHPTSLVLVEQSSDSIVARFAYSRDGTDATRGAEVGQMDFFGGNKSEDQNWVELVLATCVVAMQHWKSMGRHYRNDVTPRSCSIIGLGNATGGTAHFRRASNFL